MHSFTGPDYACMKISEKPAESRTAQWNPEVWWYNVASVTCDTVVGREGTELVIAAATRAAVLAATMSCCSSEYLLLHVVHVI